MKNLTSVVAGLESLVQSLRSAKEYGELFATRIRGIAQRVLASVRAFLCREVTPSRFERFERRLERLFRELARLLLERTVNQIESSKRPDSVTWEDRAFEAYARRERSMDTRVGTIRYRRWLHMSEWFLVRGIAPLDKRLGLTGNRVSP